MRKCDKSKFRDVIIDLFPSSKILVTECPTLSTNSTNHELIVDFLFLLHQPPPPDIQTFSSFATYLWVIKLGIKRGANVIRIVVDKPKYLPKPRDILHVSRSTKTGKMNISECEVCDDGDIPHCSEYQQFLANAQSKKKFVHYLMDHFTQLSCSKQLPIQIIVDYDDLHCPISIYNGEVTELPMLQNKNGEADYNVWYHCMISTSRHIIVLGVIQTYGYTGWPF